MNQNNIPLTFDRDGKTFKQLKRNDKVVMYEETNSTGATVGYHVFAPLTSGGSEVFPTADSIGIWAWNPTQLSRADLWFDRITNGDTPIPNVDPITNLSRDLQDDRTVDELPETPVEVPTVEDVIPTTVEIPTAEVPVVEIPTVEVTVVATAEVPVVEVPTVEVTEAPKVKAVKVPKVYPTMKFPAGEWTRTDFALLNGLKPANSESYGALIREVKAGRVVEVRKDSTGKGKPKSIYSIVSVPVTVEVPTDVPVAVVEVPTVEVPVVEVPAVV